MRVTEASDRRVTGKFWIAAASILIVAYTTLSHYCNTHGAHRLGAALSLGPFLAVGSVVLWRSLAWPVALALSMAVALLLYDRWLLLENNFSLVYLLQECAMYGLLAFGFWRSLGPTNVALCTHLADRLHGPLTPREVRYTRQVTIAWAVFFTALTSITVLLYVAAPRSVWSAFVNFIALPLVALMFVAEYKVRRHALPTTQRGGIMATVRIFLASR